jgi:hypothetical protein
VKLYFIQFESWLVILHQHMFTFIQSLVASLKILQRVRREHCE